MGMFHLAGNQRFARGRIRERRVIPTYRLENRQSLLKIIVWDGSDESSRGLPVAPPCSVVPEGPNALEPDHEIERINVVHFEVVRALVLVSREKRPPAVLVSF